MFRLLSVWSGALPTVKPLFPTNLPQDFPFDPQEFAVFVLLGYDYFLSKNKLNEKENIRYKNSALSFVTQHGEWRTEMSQ